MCGIVSTFVALLKIGSMDTRTRYNLPLADIPEGEYEREYEREYICDDAFFRERESPVHGGDVRVYARVVRRGDIYRCSLGLEGTVDVVCDRCLGEMQLSVDAGYDVEVRYGDRYDDSRDNVIVIPGSVRNLDLTDLIYDTVLLGLPFRTVHREGECDPEMESLLREHGNPEEDEEEAAD